MSDNTERPGQLPAAWDGSLDTGVATIDLQHKVLFDLLLRTREASARGLSIDLEGLLPQLRSYADYHFRHEEDWIRQHTPGGADDASHAHLHKGFLVQLDRLEQRLDEGRLNLQPVLTFLGDWLLDHIARQDVPLIQGLLRAGDGTARSVTPEVGQSGAPTSSATSATPSTRPVIRSPGTTAPTPSGVPV